MKQKTKAEEPATKKDLQGVEEKLRFEIKTSAYEILVKVDENAKKYRDQILTKLDGVMGELETMRQENTIGTYQISNLQATVDNHDKIVKHLEKIQQAA